VPNEDPLIFYKKLAEFAKIHLKNNGLIYMEINQQFGQETADIFRTSSFSSVELLKDMFGNNRFIKAVKK
jgi:release factor glutamine methyltransferase